MHKGIIVEFLVKGYILVDLKIKKKIYAQNKGKLKKYNINKKNICINNKIDIKIGDIVLYEYKQDVFLIDSILPRKNFLVRPNIANIDQVFLVFSVIKPYLEFKLLDKFLLILKKTNLKVILIFTKVDLISQAKLIVLKQKLSYYEKFYSIYYINYKNKKNLIFLYPFFKDKITIFAGQTGVGKSTIINSLTNFNIKTQEVSDYLNRGKHTTKNSKLYFFQDGYIADTPGFSKLFLLDIKPQEIKNFYDDFLIFSKKCFFGNNCLHFRENKCAVKEAYQKGLILDKRYKNYLSFFIEMTKKKEKKIF
ncbi:ribosome small subunit-dependent GTPase A [Candidatus Phytoplasma oryzae]|uniref:Small ribosomal subunit biogenesis GTPase RsgA n=1 Tax=Candidatus Phytoplasma oryzae TaxID=203274 RepID=A0A139JQV5_9MOLU|nr:ribosome small subunit-dependent GTPase A [Candidatus Phytoplasma oryzae]KXT29243.1 ribosome small subunit-dependent GTPase A [Candidatus Phytoplasma oryzae]KXT29353.1 ribosome small subunit-dependent GTPase A [Candidatus Phytoplasma oryzae]RAM57905.1 ribosome biogenesis GTPase RsgA [Candidatus Phytoplasma oryzae]